MYKRYFDLTSNPFNNSPDPRFLCMLPHTREALACLEHGLEARKGFVVLTGEVGTGKTTLLRHALASLHSRPVQTSFVFNPRLDVLDFLETVLVDFGVTPLTRTRSGMLQQLNQWLISCYTRSETCILIVDEAQNLSPDMLEEVRLLTNLETDREKLLQIVLSGQPELEYQLNKPESRQLRQRVALWCRTRSLDEWETAQYIRSRVETAGRRTRLFADEAEAEIFRISQGIPRLINLLCEHALIRSFVDEVPVVPAEIVRVVAEDLNLYRPHGQGDAVAAAMTSPEQSRRRS